MNKRPWAWIGDRDVEAERWHPGGESRAAAIRAARKARFKRFVIAPCRRATRKDVDGWCGDGDIKVGDWMVTDKWEDFPKRRKSTRR